MESELEQALAGLWRDEKPAAAGHRIAVVEALEQRYGIRLPDDFRRYVAELSHDAEWMHDSIILFWAPTDIKSFKDECATEDWSRYTASEIDAEADRYLVFADYAFWCYAYAICCSEGPNRGKIAMLTSPGSRFAASSFCSFVRLVTEDSIRLHSPGGDHYTDIV